MQRSLHSEADTSQLQNRPYISQYRNAYFSSVDGHGWLHIGGLFSWLGVLRWVPLFTLIQAQVMLGTWEFLSAYHMFFVSVLDGIHEHTYSDTCLRLLRVFT